jgi:eukaryotic-like serine/threonine-protein kinase
VTSGTERLSAALAGRYTIERELGAGGMATVYLAHDRRHNRDVALKCLRPALAAVLGSERFLQEIHISARLDHPHILTLIDSGENDGFVWYVLPFVRGESLRARLAREKQLGLEDAVRITGQIASALDYAHSQGVIHRDIKPENILLHEGEAVVADFGIALAVREAGGQRLTESGLSLGTPQYMSPEQATGDLELDARWDVYSLASMVYEMLAGEPTRMIDSVRSKAAVGDVLAARGLAEYYAEAGSATESLRWLKLAYAHSPTAEDPQSITSGLYDKVRNDSLFVAGLARIRAQINARTQRARRASP